MHERLATKTLRLVVQALLFAPLALTGCSGGSSATGGPMFVQACSLGCNNGNEGDQVFCQIINAFQNQEIAVLFSEPVDPASVDAASFRVVQVGGGLSPSGQFVIDPQEPRRLIFRPSLTFDTAGSPTFGFSPNTSYQIVIPGEGQGDSPPFIRSRSGRSNQTRLQCTIYTDQGVQDPVPGRPTVRILADTVTAFDINGDPLTIARDQVLTMAPLDTIDVLRTSSLKFVFSEIMNPVTIANNLTGLSTSIRVETDLDGQVGTTGDRTPVEGRFTVIVDQANLSTTATFVPTLGYPSGGDTGVAPTRPVFVRVLGSVSDVVGEGITSSPAGLTYGFYPERRSFPALELPRPGGETFALSAGSVGSLEDASRSSGAWGGGRLSRGEGGGSGRLGDLIIASGETLTLNTDSTTFPMPGQTIDVLGNTVGVDFPGQGANTIEVTDGGFEFGRVSIATGGTLRITGDNAARLYSRGPLTVAPEGLIDISGTTPEQHDSSIALPSAGKRVFRDDGGMFVAEDITVAFGPGGPGAGDGGFGGDRFNHSASTAILNLIDPTSDALDILTPTGAGSVPNGRPGMGVGGSGIGRGLGGPRNPSGPYPVTDTNASGNLETLNFNLVDPEACIARQVGAPGSGGGFALPGGEGLPASASPLADFPGGSSNLPANTPPGDPGDLLVPPSETNSGYFVRRLEYFGGLLIGGSGGGGGGNHPYATAVAELAPVDCYDMFAALESWHDHSGAPGGGGGGAIQLRSGSSVSIDGVVDASGGDGGSGAQVPAFNPVFGRFAAPGGGGSGGAIMIGAPNVSLAAQPGRLDVSGGSGGATNMAEPPAEVLAMGGAGSQGLIRIEDSANLASRAALAPSVGPPGDAGNNFGLAWVSVAPGQWQPARRRRPESLSGSMSCWVRPAGSFFSINYDSDTGLESSEQGWNMDIIYRADLQGGEIMIPFRGDNSGGSGIPNFEAAFGNQFNVGLPDGTGSPVCVRFQGARISAPTGTDFCGLQIGDPDIVPFSVTPWVEHPEELNTFNPLPNAFRFSVTFDRSVPPYATNGGNPTNASAVRGVTNLLLRASPE